MLTIGRWLGQQTIEKQAERMNEAAQDRQSGPRCERWDESHAAAESIVYEPTQLLLYPAIPKRHGSRGEANLRSSRRSAAIWLGASLYFVGNIPPKGFYV